MLTLIKYCDSHFKVMKFFLICYIMPRHFLVLCALIFNPLFSLHFFEFFWQCCCAHKSATAFDSVFMSVGVRANFSLC